MTIKVKVYYLNETKLYFIKSVDEFLKKCKDINYTKVYENSRDENNYTEALDILNDTFITQFNIGNPKDFTCRPLSSGDIVVINDEAYLCLSIGWEKIKDNKIKLAE